MKFREISEHEFKGMYQFFENNRIGFGVVATYTNMGENYAETKFGYDDKVLLKTEHVNGVNSTPIFYEVTRA